MEDELPVREAHDAFDGQRQLADPDLWLRLPGSIDARIE